MVRLQNCSRGTLSTIAVVLIAGIAAGAVFFFKTSPESSPSPTKSTVKLNYQPRKLIDTSGLLSLSARVEPWDRKASLEQVARAWERIGFRTVESVDREMKNTKPYSSEMVQALCLKAEAFSFEGQPRQAFHVLEEARSLAESDADLAEEWLYTIIFFQGVTGLRRGEDENCIMCRGESSCIIPISPPAVHTKPEGSRLAIKYFTEYLEQFPDDLGIRWLLSVCHMTLGEYPGGADPRYVVRLDRYFKSEFDIGKFRDIGHLVGVNRFNRSGGGIMDDFDNDGLLDIVSTTVDATQPMAFFRNKGDGTFEDRTRAAKLDKQLGGLYCVQTDYNNDGHLDIFIPRGAWIVHPIRPSLLRNNGDGTFTDVTEEAGLMEPVNSISATWADYDNDGFLDLFVCCERQPNRLYRNKGDGTFEEVSVKAGVAGDGKAGGKGAAWFDFDNDGYPDLFLNNFRGPSQLFHNNRNGTFSDVTRPMGINGPEEAGFSCWAWDYDNDGWLDIFATYYFGPFEHAVKGILGHESDLGATKLYRNIKGQRFEDVTREVGLDMAFLAMGTNFADFDNDGYLDFYLGTGDPNLSSLIPNRMFKNVEGKRFADITTSSGTGHLQKGHSVACGDWDRNGSVDLFIQMGGAVDGDKYHNILFQNPGQGNNWLTVKLVGKKSNRAAIGARIKAVTSGDKPLTLYRHVSSGSSFGANPLQQTLGLAKAERLALLEITWPTSGAVQVFRDIAINQAIEVTEFAADYRKLDWKPIPLPK